MLVKQKIIDIGFLKRLTGALGNVVMVKDLLRLNWHLHLYDSPSLFNHICALNTTLKAHLTMRQENPIFLQKATLMRH